ncbi:hypothetical protein HK099_008671 [Clydaea vesicula]|uniref:EF-hand domain-containing protein n=1 Tax=Clydaea vesicula TaxID=447962 RepID=A0AAD5XXT9_9FUNG|nr:hypothetical protein HK099_008671 [Clydaea vesicula]KAJ3382434.1 hypothetical protein HDU92_004763 [Lobulomyces angularis]
MGAGASVEERYPKHFLPSKDIYFLTRQYSLSIAEVEYCHERYLQFKSQKETFNSKENHQQQHHWWNKSEEKVKVTYDFHDSLSEMLKVDWLLSRVFNSIFSNETVENITFSNFLKGIFWWKNLNNKQKISFIFKLLDYNQDGKITASDLTVFIQQIVHYQFKVGDKIKIRHDPRQGTLMFLGETKFSEGIWAGLALDNPDGKNNGTVQNVRYFECEDQHGVFIPFLNLETTQHYNMALDIILQFTGNSKKNFITEEMFLNYLITDNWLERIFQQNVLPTALKD